MIENAPLSSNVSSYPEAEGFIFEKNTPSSLNESKWKNHWIKVKNKSKEIAFNFLQLRTEAKEVAELAVDTLDTIPDNTSTIPAILGLSSLILLPSKIKGTSKKILNFSKIQKRTDKIEELADISSDIGSIGLLTSIATDSIHHILTKYRIALPWIASVSSTVIPYAMPLAFLKFPVLFAEEYRLFSLEKDLTVNNLNTIITEKKHRFIWRKINLKSAGITDKKIQMIAQTKVASANKTLKSEKNISLNKVNDKSLKLYAFIKRVISFEKKKRIFQIVALTLAIASVILMANPVVSSILLISMATLSIAGFIYGKKYQPVWKEPKEDQLTFAC